jgi:prolyl oligopeptidase
VIDIESGNVLDDRLDWVKFSSVEWTPDSKGFFYGRYQAPKEGTEYQGLNLNQKLYYHRVGTAQSDDILVYQTPEHPEWGFGTHVTEDGRYLIISTWKGTDDRNRVTYKDLTEPLGMPLDLIDHFDNEYTFLGSNGSTLYFRTDLEATRRRIIAIDLRRPEPENWRQIVAESPDTLQWSRFVGNMFLLGYLHDAKTAVRLYAEDGRFVREVSLPGIGTASGFWGQRPDTETFYSFSSFNVPTSIYRYDLISGTSELIQRADVGINPDDFQVKQVFYDSKDGTKVPMFIVHKTGIELDGSNPTLLYGYGGFDISQVPRFSIARLAWMEMGGVFALANLRGGGEYGAEWHKAGTKLQKQNVFDDFIAAAEYLIDEKVTSSEKLAIQGGSNGGLLVGAAMTQRPELFGAALPAVGVMDMLRFHKFTAGRFWTDDYGSSDNPEEFKAIYAYSPYHNLTKGTEYPPTLVTTADTDDRVVPGHSFKFVSELQWAHRGDNPVLIRIETRAGHGAGKPTSKRIEEIADQWAFLVESLGMDIGPKVEAAMSQEGM